MFPKDCPVSSRYSPNSVNLPWKLFERPKSFFNASNALPHSRGFNKDPVASFKALAVEGRILFPPV